MCVVKFLLVKKKKRFRIKQSVWNIINLIIVILVDTLQNRIINCIGHHKNDYEISTLTHKCFIRR